MYIKIRILLNKNVTALTLVWALIIFVLCATPGQYIPSANWLELLSFDKFVHAFIFFVLNSLLFIVGFKYKKPPVVFLVYFLLCAGYGSLLELMQAYCFSNRSADWKDIIANTFGCVLALIMLRKIKAFTLA